MVFIISYISFYYLWPEGCYKILGKTGNSCIYLECDTSRGIYCNSSENVYNYIYTLILQNPRRCSDEIPTGKASHFLEQAFVKCGSCHLSGECIPAIHILHDHIYQCYSRQQETIHNQLVYRVELQNKNYNQL